MRLVFPSGLLLSLIFAQALFAKTEALRNAQGLQLIKKHPIKTHYRFAVTGDNRDGNSIFRQLLQHASQYKPRFMLHTGDFVPTGTQSQYLTFLSLIDQVDFPVFPALGNHDAYQGGRRWYNQYFGPSYWAFDYGQDRFVFLDNANGELSAGQLEWYENQLKLKRRYFFVSMHMPPRNIVWFHAFSEGALEMRRLSEKYGVKYVFLGHIHIYDKIVTQGVHYVVSGGAGAPLYRMPLYIDPQGGAYNHYLLIDVGPGGIQEKIIRLNAPAAPS